jgi:hypothetical protein
MSIENIEMIDIGPVDVTTEISACLPLLAEMRILVENEENSTFDFGTDDIGITLTARNPLDRGLILELINFIEEKMLEQIATLKP